MSTYPPAQQSGESPFAQTGAESSPSAPVPFAPQLELPDFEKANLVRRISDDHASAQMAHKKRLDRVDRNQKRWRPETGLAGGTSGKSNFQVPLTQSQVFVKWAKVVEQMLGDDTEISAVPTGPSDQERVAKIGLYMTWLVFTAMGIANDLIEWTFQYILHGVAIAYTPYECIKFDTPDGPVKLYEGPGFHPLQPDDIILPAENFKSLQDASWIIREYDATLNDLLDGEEQGIYSGISESFDKLVEAARTQVSHGQGTDDRRNRDTQDQQQGIDPGWGQSYNEKLRVREWYGGWRLLEDADEEAEEQPDGLALAGREQRQTELVVRCIPQLEMYIGGQKLVDLYPRMKDRRPFVRITLVKDGSAWPPGLGELIEFLEQELTVNHNLATEAVERSIGPILFFVPGVGFDPETFKYEPGTAVPTTDPNSVKAVTLSADLNGSIEREHTTFRWVERLTGLTDLQSGRASDRPNSPRTARQTLMIAEEGNIRVFLDTTVLRNDLAVMLKHFWEIDTMYGSDKVFFRVTEEQAKGLFDTEAGGAYITQVERAGRYDFQLKFASSVHSKEARKQNALALYQVHLSNPYIAQNPRAMWWLAKQISKAFGVEMPDDVFPEPPAPDIPVMPDHEWNKLLEGEDIHVHPADDDDRHLREHDIQVGGMLAEPEERQDKQAIIKMLAHQVEHERQKQAKQMAIGRMQAMMQRMLPQMAGPGMVPGPQLTPSSGPPMPADELQLQPSQDEMGALPQMGY